MPDHNPYAAPGASPGVEEPHDSALALARDLGRRGLPLEVIATRLSRRGFDPAVVGGVITRLPPRVRSRSPWRSWLGGRGPFVLLAFGVLTIGGGVALGNVTGMAPSIPDLGSGLIMLGLFLLRASQS